MVHSKRISGDAGYVVPPVPIPNTVVKHIYAESTCLETDWEDRELPVKQKAFTLWMSFFVLQAEGIFYSLWNMFSVGVHSKFLSRKGVYLW